MPEHDALRGSAQKGAKPIDWVAIESFLPGAGGPSERSGAWLEHLDELGIVDRGHAPAAVWRPLPQPRVEKAGCLHRPERGGAAMALVVASSDGWGDHAKRQVADVAVRHSAAGIVFERGREHPGERADHVMHRRPTARLAREAGGVREQLLDRDRFESGVHRLPELLEGAGKHRAERSRE